MKRLAALVAGALVLAVASVGLAAPAQAATLTVAQYEAAIAAAINESRDDAGLPDLTVSVSVGAVARSWSQHMGDSGSFQHNPSYAAQIPGGWTSASENIAYGAVTSGQYPVSAIHEMLMDSSGHRANILRTASTHVGVGVDFVSRGGYQYVYVTENFAAYPDSVSPDPRSTARYAGDTRYASAVVVGKKTFGSADEVVVAPGAQSHLLYALVAQPFAFDRSAPLLLTAKSTLSSATRAEIVRRAPDKVWIVGGTGVVSSGVYRELKALGVTVQRLGTSTLSGTAAAVAAQMPSATAAFIVSTSPYSKYQAVAAAGPAAAAGRPILIVGRDFVPSVTDQAIRAMDASRLTLIGDTSVISSPVYVDLKVYGATMQRLSGKDRWTSASAVATQFASITGSDRVVVASGYRDYLFDAVLAGGFGHPVLLSGKSWVPATTTSWVDRRGTEHVDVVGRSNVVTSKAVAKLR